MSKLLKLVLLALSFSVLGFAQTEETKITDESPLFELPDNAYLVMNKAYQVRSGESTVGKGGLQAVIETIEINLIDDDHKSRWSRNNNWAAINVLSELKRFDEIKSILCFVDFNTEIHDHFTLEKGTKLHLKTPDHFGTPDQKRTKLGRRVTLDERWYTNTISGSFEADDARRLYCSFKTTGSDHGIGFFDDFKIKHLKVLLSPYFEVEYE